MDREDNSYNSCPVGGEHLFVALTTKDARLLMLSCLNLSVPSQTDPAFTFTRPLLCLTHRALRTGAQENVRTGNQIPNKVQQVSTSNYLPGQRIVVSKQSTMKLWIWTICFPLTRGCWEGLCSRLQRRAALSASQHNERACWAPANQDGPWGTSFEK